MRTERWEAGLGGAYGYGGRITAISTIEGFAVTVGWFAVSRRGARREGLVQ